MPKITTDATVYEKIRAARAKSGMPAIPRRMYEIVEGFVTGIQAAIAKNADKIFDSAGISRDKKGNLLSALILRNLDIKLEVASPFFAELFSAQPGIKNTLLRNIRSTCFLSENSHFRPRIKPDTNIEKIMPAFLDDILQKDTLQVLRKYANSLGINMKEVERFVQTREQESFSAGAAAVRSAYLKLDSKIRERVDFETYLEIHKFISRVNTESLRSAVNEKLKSYWKAHTAESLLQKARGMINRAIAETAREIENERVKKIFSKQNAKKNLIKMIIDNRFMSAFETAEKFTNAYLAEIWDKYPDILTYRPAEKKHTAGRALTAAKNGRAFKPEGISSLEAEASVKSAADSLKAEKMVILRLALEAKKERNIMNKNPGEVRETEIVYFLRQKLGSRFTTTEIHIFAEHIESHYDAITENALPENFVSGINRIFRALRKQPSGGIPSGTFVKNTAPPASRLEEFRIQSGIAPSGKGRRKRRGRNTRAAGEKTMPAKVGTRVETDARVPGEIKTKDVKAKDVKKAPEVKLRGLPKR